MYTQEMKSADDYVDSMEVGDLIECMLENYAKDKDYEGIPFRKFERAKERLNEMFKLED